MQLAYFADDGNYGLENGNFVLLDVSKWTEEDWLLIENADAGWARPTIAKTIAKKYELEI